MDLNENFVMNLQKLPMILKWDEKNQFSLQIYKYKTEVGIAEVFSL